MDTTNDDTRNVAPTPTPINGHAASPVEEMRAEARRIRALAFGVHLDAPPGALQNTKAKAYAEELATGLEAKAAALEALERASKPAAEKWAWMREGDEYAHGPFDTREEAIADAVDDADGSGGSIVLGHPRYPIPEEWVPESFGVMELLEAMDGDALANDFHDVETDALFEVNTAAGPESDPPYAQAERELEEALRAWIRKWVVAEDVWVLDEPMETVMLRPLPEGRR